MFDSGSDILAVIVDGPRDGPYRALTKLISACPPDCVSLCCTRSLVSQMPWEEEQEGTAAASGTHPTQLSSKTKAQLKQQLQKRQALLLGKH